MLATDGCPQADEEALRDSKRWITLHRMTPTDALALSGGAATPSQLLRHGVAKRAIAAAVAAGDVLRVRRGVYALPQADRVVIARVAWRCEPTCLTAAKGLGLPVSSRDERLHVAVDHRRSSTPPHAWPPPPHVVHMPAALPVGPVIAIDVIDSAARCATRIEQLEMIDAALNRGLMSEGDLAAMRYTSGERVRWLARHCDGRSQSLLETRTRIALRAAGLRVQPQVAIPGVGRVDFVVNDAVVVETDGLGTHALAGAFDEDRRRDRESLLAGYPVMRFGYADVMGDIGVVVEQVKAAASLAPRLRP